MKNIFCNTEKKKATKSAWSSARGGFTLIELMVVIALFALLSTFVVIQFASTSARSALFIGQNRLISTTKDAREKVVSGAKFESGFPAYGVMVEKDGTEVTLFADCDVDDNGDGRVNENDDFTFSLSASACGASGGDDVVEKVEFGNNVFVESITYDEDPSDGNPGVSVDQVFIEYTAPLLKVWITGEGQGLLLQGNIVVELNSPGANFSKSVTIWSSGLTTLEEG